MGAMRRTLIVTNDFPPRQGGIQSFVHALALRLDPGKLTVYAPRWDGAREFDAAQPFEVVRHPTSLMIGGPAVTPPRRPSSPGHRGAEAVIFGAAAPLGLITPALRRAGIERAIAITHGHEAGWAALPVARNLLRRIGDETDVVTYLGEYFRVRLARALSPAAAARMVQLHPAVDAAQFRPDPAARDIVRDRYGLGGRPVVVCVSRLVRTQGPGHAARSVARGADEGPRRIPADRRFRSALGCSPSVVRTYRADSKRPLHRSGAGRRASRALRGRATSSPCRAGPGAAASTWRASASSTWRRRRPGCRWSAATRAAPLTRSSRERPATWSAAATPARWPDGSSPCCTDPATARAMGDKGRAWVERDWSWDLTAARLRSLLE